MLPQVMSLDSSTILTSSGFQLLMPSTHLIPLSPFHEIDDQFFVPTTSFLHSTHSLGKPILPRTKSNPDPFDDMAQLKSGNIEIDGN
jgi:hypothetical protein